MTSENEQGSNPKCVCEECGWIGMYSELLVAKHPFRKYVGESVTGCPRCHDINTIVVACDEPGCWRPVSCGTPTEKGYRNTCGEHAPNT